MTSPVTPGSRLVGKVAIVTGGASGYGEGIAKRFAQEGAKVMVADLDGVGGQRVASSMPDHRRPAPKGKTMGHAGALLSPGEKGAAAKARALERAGAIVVAHPGLMGTEMKRLLKTR